MRKMEEHPKFGEKHSNEIKNTSNQNRNFFEFHKTGSRKSMQNKIEISEK